MGNASRSVYFHNSHLLHQVDDSLSFLAFLSLSTISQLVSKQQSLFIQKTFISSTEFKRLCLNTQFEDSYEKIIEKFSPLHNTINIYEFLSAIITYSELRWQNKVSLLFKVFDFDKSKLLTNDELIIMSKCFFKAVQTMTRNKFKLPFTFEGSVITDSFFLQSNTDGISLAG